MDIEIREFVAYLHNIKKMSANTEVSYQRDLKKMAEFLGDRGVKDLKEVRELELEGYISYMEREHFASSSISRSVASIRAFFNYLWKEGHISKDPAENLKPPKVEKKAPEILTIEEVDKLLQQPDLNTVKGIRDSAMLELLYATGMRVSEMLHLQITDVNLQFGYVVCHENGKERIIPIGVPCKKAMEHYLESARNVFVKDQQKNLKNPAVIVDTNHSNSNKQYDQQVRIAKEVLHSRQVDPELHTLVKGLMIESYIEPGNQKIGCDHIYGKSITDPCLGWEESEKLLYTIAEMC